VAKKPARVPTDTLTAIAGLGVEISLLADKVDAIATRVVAAEKKLDDAKGLKLHLIEVKEELIDLKSALSPARPWWRVW
jgi:hypothetical protein